MSNTVVSLLNSAKQRLSQTDNLTKTERWVKYDIQRALHLAAPNLYPKPKRPK